MVVRAVSLLVLAGLLSGTPAQASKWHWADRTCRADACLHAATAYALTFTGSELLLKKAQLSPWHSLLLSSATVFVLGLAKEQFVDGKWEGRDVAANTIGIAGAAGMFWVLEF